MKFQNLPPNVLNKIISFLPPKARVMLLVAFENFKEIPAVESKPTLYCPFCMENLLHKAVVVEKEGEFESLRKKLRYELHDETWEAGADGVGLRYRKRTYRLRDYTRNIKDLNDMYSELGRVLEFYVYS